MNNFEWPAAQSLHLARCKCEVGLRLRAPERGAGLRLRVCEGDGALSCLVLAVRYAREPKCSSVRKGAISFIHRTAVDGTVFTVHAVCSLFCNKSTVQDLFFAFASASLNAISFEGNCVIQNSTVVYLDAGNAVATVH